MLSYRHAFHAGNHADVLKHLILTEVVNYFCRKEKPWWFIDTHAGAGCYSLRSSSAQKTGEFVTGIARLCSDVAAVEVEREPLVQQYLQVVKQFNPSDNLLFYPGSPALVRTFLRAHDKMKLFELHPQDFATLAQTFDEDAKTVCVRQSDGFEGLKALLPPSPKRAIVLIDPPYEVKQDYQNVIDVLKSALRRFPQGTYIVWYPLLTRVEARSFSHKLCALKSSSWLNVQCLVQAAESGAYGLYGSGLYIINPPYQLPAQLDALMPRLTKALAQDKHASFVLDANIV